MRRPIDKTFARLRKTRNEAAGPLLIEALDSSVHVVRDEAVRALAFRRDPAGHRELLRRWPSLSDRWKSLIAERPARFSATLRDILVGGDPSSYETACDAAIHLQEYDLIPTLVSATEDGGNVHADQAAETLVALSENLREELSMPRDYVRRRDPQLVRQHVLGSLESSIERFEKHQRNEIAESFLLLAKLDNSTLKRIVVNPHHPAHAAIQRALLSSPRPGVMRIAIGLVRNSPPPKMALQLIGKRGDIPFLRRLAKSFDAVQTHGRSVRRIKSLQWLRDPTVLLALTEREQAALLRFIAASGVSDDNRFRAVRLILQRGRPEGRRAAAELLRLFHGAEANRLAIQLLDDGDPAVQAMAAGQIRQRSIPDAMSRLLAKLDSPHETVRQAAQQCLGEFHFERFLAAFDMLPDDVRYSTGRLIRKADPGATSKLAAELDSRSRIKRLRALKIAPLIGAVAAVEEKIIELLQDDDHFIRTEAALALSQSCSDLARQALHEALSDRSLAVQEAAERSLKMIPSSS